MWAMNPASLSSRHRRRYVIVLPVSPSSAAVNGRGNGWEYGPSSSWLTLQSTACWLSPVPRGSHATRSKRSLSGAAKSAAARRKSNVEPPGPPGFMNSDPIRCEGSVAGLRISASSVVRPRGRS